MAYTGTLALISGAGSGMGQLAAKNLAATGATVIALDLDHKGLQDTAAGSDSVHTYVVDVTNIQAVNAIVEQVLADHGVPDRVMTAAGIMPTGKIVDMETPLIHKVMAVNYGGTVNVVKALLPAMLAEERGEIVTFGSMAGVIPTLLFGAYNASKFAVVSFTEVLAHEHRGSGVKFSCICPPLVATPLLDREKDRVKQLKNRQPLQPQQVLDAIERGVERGQLMIFPDSVSKLGWRMRRFVPDLVWRTVHSEEGF